MKILPYHLPEITFLPADPTTGLVADRLAALIREADEHVVVEHIGSTSIPGMPGKNSINLLVLVQKDEFEASERMLERLGFHDHPFKKEPSDRPLKVGSVEVEGGLYGVHVHIIELNSDNHRNSVFFRDYLTQHPEEVARYAEIKRQLADQKLSSEEYNAAKQPFIRDIISRRPA
jgi:GrpB-like predicted nucleotidyltransferase (UPF0157 family)